MIRARWVATAAVAAIVTLGGAVPATAQSTDSDPTAIHLEWDGESPATADESFVGVPVAVPGDRAVRTLKVRNDGPTTGVLRGWVQEVELLEPTKDDDFYDDLRLDWKTARGRQDASFRELARTGRTQITRTELQPGESTELTVGYTFPVAATTGNRSLVGAREASFVVHLDLRGALPPDAGNDGGGGDGGNDDGGNDEGGNDDGQDDTPDIPVPDDDDLARTGAEALQVGMVAAAGIGLGGLLLGASRRRRDRDAGGSSQHPSTRG